MRMNHAASAAVLAAFSLFALASSKPKTDDAAPTTPATSTGAPPAAAATNAAPAAAKAVTLKPLAIKNSGSAVPDLTIDAPEGAKFEEKFTNTVVTAGDAFQLMISNAKMDPKETKKTYASADALMKATKFDVDAPDALLYEGEFLGSTGWHIDVNVKVGPTNFTCTDWRKLGSDYTKGDVETMLKACRSLRKK